MSYGLDDQYEKGIQWCEKAVKQNPDDFFARLMLTAVYSMAGQDDKAHAEAMEVLRINPKYSLAKAEKRAKIKYKDKWFAALRKAGLPENPPLPLPDKPSIAVLPFKNLSGEPEQEYLADGITESIIGTISRVSGLFVIASNSVFTYKGKAVKVQTVSKELGVRHVLEGTVQKAGNQLRVNAQLIDAISGHHLWSKKYDQHMKDIFSVQDHVSKEILTALRVKFLEGEQELVWARGTDDLEAYLRYLKAYDSFKSFNRRNMILTRQICEEAIALDPNCEPAYSLKGMSYLIDLWFGWAESYSSAIENCEKALKISISINPQSDFAYANLGHLYLLQRRHDEALVAGKKSVDLNPNGDYNMVLLAMTLMYSGRSEEAIPLYKDAWRRNPYCPAWYIHAAGVAYRNLGKWEEAIAACKKALVRKPDHFPALDVMASVYGMSGQLEKGRAVAAEIMKINPGFCVEKQTLPYKKEADAEAVYNSFLKVGIPGCPKE
jgi:adenylate cyclase